MPTVKVLRDLAKKLEVENYGKLRKADLIRAIQLAEGNTDCYERIPDCRQMDCLFRVECLSQ